MFPSMTIKMKPVKLIVTSFLFGLTVTSPLGCLSKINYSLSHLFPSLDLDSAAVEHVRLKRDLDIYSITPNRLDGIYWRKEIEEFLPPGYSQEDSVRWRKYLRNSSVVRMEEGCGSKQNCLLVFEDRTMACCRHRQETYLIQGEMFSFYLGRILGLKNLIPTSLAVVKPKSTLWSKVKQEILLAGWLEDTPVTVTKYLNCLERTYIPGPHRPIDWRLHPDDVQGSPLVVLELAQWSDMIVFDYLIANHDRVVGNMMYLEDHPDFKNISTLNLRKDSDSGLLVFLDNEYGILDGYRTLHEYEFYHDALLKALCVFRRPTIDALVKLKTDGNVGYLLNTLSLDEPDRRILPRLSEKIITILNNRIKRVLNHVAWCEQRYSKPQ